MRGGNRNAEKRLFRYFDEEVRRIVPPGPAAWGEAIARGARARPALRGLLAHAAVVVVCAGALCALPPAVTARTPLREAIVLAVREKAYMKHLPSAEAVKESVESFMNRRNRI